MNVYRKEPSSGSTKVWDACSVAKLYLTRLWDAQRAVITSLFFSGAALLPGVAVFLVTPGHGLGDSC